MLIVPCFACYTAVRVMGEPDAVFELVGEGSDFWPATYHCVLCGKRCDGMLESDVEVAALQKMKVRELSPEEMLAAQSGLGTPEEMLCSGTTVRELLKQPVKKVHGYDLKGTTRFCLDALELEDGTKIHLGAGPSGAVVYRISRPFSYAQRALEETNE